MAREINKEKYVGSDGNEYLRQPVLTFCRVMGYLQNTRRFNQGKKTEFYSRKNFTEGHTCQREISMMENNAKFNQLYGI